MPRSTVTAPLFPGFLIADSCDPAPPASSQRASDFEDRLIVAITNILPSDNPNAIDVATALADVALGRSAVLKIRSTTLTDRTAAATLLEQLVRLTEAVPAARQEDAITKLASIVLPDPLADARGPLAADNLQLRDRFLREVPTLTGTDVASRSGLRSKNPYATAARWKRNGEIFSVNHRGAEHFPAFQFRDGRPHPSIKLALMALPESMSTWQRAFWFVSANGWLDDAAPLSCLDAADRIVEAAKRETDELIG